MTNPVPNSHAIVEPFYQQLLAERRRRDVSGGLLCGIGQPVRPFAQAVLELLESANKHPLKKVVLKVVKNDYQDSFWSPEQ